jgi:hypothetical protein
MPHTSVEIRTVTGSSLAGEKEILDLIQHTDQVAEIPNSLRLGTEVRLDGTKAIVRP